MTRYGRMARLFAAAGMVALVAACGDNGPGVGAPPPAPLAELEGASGLPDAGPAQVEYSAPEQAYPYAERAYGVQRAFYDTPPDYGFAYDDVSPYVWETTDDWALYAEPWEGDYRYYYYEPGAAHPYFVRDRDYGYAYGATGLLIAMFYTDGRYAPLDVLRRHAPVAGRYYARGQDLRRVGQRTQHFRVADRVWVNEAPRVSRGADPWLRAARDDKRWREWRERDGDGELRRFAAETRRRQAAAGAWRERTAREKVATIERGQDRLEAQAMAARREGAKDDRREDGPDARRRAEASGRQAEQRRTEQRATAERQRRDALAQAQRRQSGVARPDQTPSPQSKAPAERPQAKGEVARAEQPQRRKAEVQQREKAEAERPERSRQQARTPSATERGRPATAREDAGKDPGRGKDERRKD